MEFFERFTEWLGFGTSPSPEPTPISEIRETMELARVAKRNEDYDRALAHLEQAMQVAERLKDTNSVTIIALHQADVLITSGQYDRAEELLQTILRTSDQVSQPGFMSYALSSQGVLHQKRGEWTLARESYERARDIAGVSHVIGAEGRALGHMADVYLHEGNASYAVHLLQEALPKINAAGDLELSSYFVGRLGEALTQTGQDNEGRHLLERALRLGEQMQDREMIRQWSKAIGDCLVQSGDFGEAHLFYNRALQLFPKNPQPDDINLFIQMSHVDLGLGDSEAAIEHAETAIEQATALNDQTALSRARGVLGVALRVAKRYDEAIQLLQIAVDQRGDVIDAQYLELTRNLAAAQMESGDFESALQSYEMALEKARQAGLELPIAELQRDMGILYATQRKLSEAIQQWTEALELFESQHDYNQTARLYCDLANARRQLGMSSRAIRDYEKALMALNNVTDLATRGLVLSNAANAYVDQGDIDSAMSFFKESIEIAKTIGDTAARSTRLSNYGWFLLTTGNPRKAIEVLTQALTLSREKGLKLLIAVQTNNLGCAYDGLSQYKVAMGHHQDALDLLRSLDDPPKRWLSIFSSHSSRTLISLGKIDEAQVMVDEALTIARESMDFEALMYALNGKARVLLRQSQSEAAAPLIAEAVKIGKQLELRQLLADSLALSSEQQSLVGNMDAGRELWQEAQRLYKLVGSPLAKQTPFWLGNNSPAEQ